MTACGYPPRYTFHRDPVDYRSEKFYAIEILQPVLEASCCTCVGANECCQQGKFCTHQMGEERWRKSHGPQGQKSAVKVQIEQAITHRKSSADCGKRRKYTICGKSCAEKLGREVGQRSWAENGEQPPSRPGRTAGPPRWAALSPSRGTRPTSPRWRRSIPASSCQPRPGRTSSSTAAAETQPLENIHMTPRLQRSCTGEEKPSECGKLEACGGADADRLTVHCRRRHHQWRIWCPPPDERMAAGQSVGVRVRLPWSSWGQCG